MTRQVIPFSLADAFQAARFAQERKIMQQREREGALRIQQMNEQLGQMQRQSDASDIQALLPEAVASAGRGDGQLLSTLQNNASFPMAQQQIAMQQAEQRKAQFEAEKEQIGAASQRNEVLQQRAHMTRGFVREAQRAIERGDGNAFENLRANARQALGIELPANPVELLGLEQEANAVQIEAPEMSADMRRFQEAQNNPAFAAELRRQEEQQLRRARAGGVQVVNQLPSPFGGRGELGKKELEDFRRQNDTATEAIAGLNSLKSSLSPEQFNLFQQGKLTAAQWASNLGIELDPRTRKQIQEQGDVGTQLGLTVFEVVKPYLGTIQQGERAAVEAILNNIDGGNFDKTIGQINGLVRRLEMKRQMARERLGEGTTASAPPIGERRGGQSGQAVTPQSDASLDEQRVQARSLARRFMQQAQEQGRTMSAAEAMQMALRQMQGAGQ
ncbi:MAG: hypothetical protein AAF654_14975 [Myxococcota bacterium]